MSDSPPAVAAARQSGSAPSRLAVDPAALAELAVQLDGRAAALRSGAPALSAAWQQAAAALAAQHTGEVLAATWPGSGSALEEFAASVEALALALRLGGVSYAGAEGDAVRSALPSAIAS
jgi:hypothetical protein